MNMQQAMKKSVEVMQQHFFDKKGGVKVKIVHPADERIEEINYEKIPGNIEGHLANFGKYQFGSSINASVYRPAIHKTACHRMKQDEQSNAEANGLSFDGFVLVESGGCSFETKARNIQHMGSKVALIIAQDSNGLFESRVYDNEIVDEGVQSLMYDGTGAGISIPTIVIS